MTYSNTFNLQNKTMNVTQNSYFLFITGLPERTVSLTEHFLVLSQSLYEWKVTCRKSVTTVRSDWKKG